MSPDELFSSEHRAAQESLPWLANGTLDVSERDRLRAHLRACTRCRDDLDLLQALRAAGPGPAPDCDPERAWARMLPRLDAAPAPSAAPAAAPARWRERLAANDRSWLRRAVAAQAAVIAVLAALLLRPGADPGDEPAYRGLGATAAVQSGIVVMFRPDTPERELRRIVRASGARMVGGPTDADAYLLNGDDPAATLRRLRAEPAVVLAEPLGAGERP